MAIISLSSHYWGCTNLYLEYFSGKSYKPLLYQANVTLVDLNILTPPIPCIELFTSIPWIPSLLLPFRGYTTSLPSHNLHTFSQAYIKVTHEDNNINWTTTSLFKWPYSRPTFKKLLPKICTTYNFRCRKNNILHQPERNFSNNTKRNVSFHQLSPKDQKLNPTSPKPWKKYSILETSPSLSIAVLLPEASWSKLHQPSTFC